MYDELTFRHSPDRHELSRGKIADCDLLLRSYLKADAVATSENPAQDVLL
jgi:hypothetical protein